MRGRLARGAARAGGRPGVQPHRRRDLRPCRAAAGGLAREPGGIYNAVTTGATTLAAEPCRHQASLAENDSSTRAPHQQKLAPAQAHPGMLQVRRQCDTRDDKERPAAARCAIPSEFWASGCWLNA